MVTATVGYIGIACAVLFFGSNFIPIKKYETGDGMFFQFVVCIGRFCIDCHSHLGIWVMGAIVAVIRQQNVFSLFAMMGGMIWATGNLCTVPIVKCIGTFSLILLIHRSG